MLKLRFLTVILVLAGGVLNVAQAGDFFNGFEVDDTCWFGVTRTASGAGTLGVPSKTGAWHAEAPFDSYTRFGGYGDGDTCDSASASLSFPQFGYETSVDIYLDVNGGYANASLLAYTSAINNPEGSHRRDFIFNCGFYNDDRTNDGLGAGSRFICSASNNSPGWPVDPNRDPIVVTTASGWFTFHHRFYDDGAGVLAVDLSVLDATGNLIKSWTLSTPADEINVTVGGNRYGWFPANELGPIAIDNSLRNSLTAETQPPIPTLGTFGLTALVPLMLMGGLVTFRRPT